MKKKLFLIKLILFFLIFSIKISFAQLGINSDNSAPSSNAMLDVKSTSKGVLFPRISSDLGSATEGLLYYNTTGHNFRYYDGTAWQNALFGNQWNINESKISYSAGNVGIGIADPQYKLDVSGKIHASSDIVTDQFIAIGGLIPLYKVHIFDGSLAISNSTDSKTWTLSYSSLNDYLQFTEGGISRALFRNGGDVELLKNLAVGENLTVNDGNGIVRTTNSSQMAIVKATTAANIIGTLTPNTSSGDLILNYGETFTSPPGIAWGQIIGVTNPTNIVITIGSIGNSSVVFRLRNVGATNSVFTNSSVSAMIIGEK